MHDSTSEFMTLVYRAAQTTQDAPIARAIGMPKNTLHRQLNASKPLPAETVIAICRAYDLDILQGLVTTTHLSESEREQTSAFGKLDSLPDSTLLSHLHLRALDREQTNITAIAPEGIEDDLEQPVGGREVIDLTQRARPSQTLTHNPYAGEPMAAQPDTPDASSDSLGGDES